MHRMCRLSDLISSVYARSSGQSIGMVGMPRQLRLQYPDPIYHVMDRGNGRQVIVRDDIDPCRLLGQGDGGWEIRPRSATGNGTGNGLPISRISAAVCAYSEIESSELSRRGSRHPARSAWVYLARSRTAVTKAELAVTLGLARPECVPNLTGRFAAWLTSNANTREQLRWLEERLK